MSPLARLYVGVVRAWIELLVLAYLLGLFIGHNIVSGIILTSVLAFYRLMHAVVAVMGTVSLHHSARERVNRGRDHHNRS